jgi:periplasmic protein TonB
VSAEAKRADVAGQATAAPIGSRTHKERLPLYAGAVAFTVIVVAGAVYLFLNRDNTPPPRLVHEITVKIVPPPPPPPPPPPQQPPEPKMIEQPKMVEPEVKPEKPVEKPKDEPVKNAKNDEPPGPLSLDAKAEGPGDLFQLGGHPGGNPYGGRGRSRWGWYASIVQAQIESALRANEKTRNAVMQVEIRLWADSSGRVSRVQLVSSTGDPALDAVIRNEVFGGLVLREPPPKDMPMPMVARVTARRPG